jgi:hypothetical protein
MRHGYRTIMKSYDRNDLETFIIHENKILEDCIDLINQRIPLADWPRDQRVAFLLAIQSGEGREGYKAFSLARHLRIGRRFDGYDVPINPSPLQRRRAERIRADLAGLIRLGAGGYLQI